MELGILTPEEGIESIKTGIYPNSKDLNGAQEKFVENRQKGFYNPLVGGVPMVDGVNDKQKNQQKISKEPGRPPTTKEAVEANDNLFSRKEIQKTIHKVEALRKNSMSSARKILNKKRLSKDHKSLIDSLVESVVMSKEVEEWGDCVESCLKDFDKIADLPAMSEVLSLSAEHGLEVYPSAILYHSTKDN
tara:strand:- start:68 stop:637 length:570 start_codon:yes stop_codon:yes gene_type:complete